MSTEVASYLMNPGEDVIVFGDELAEGMLVVPERADCRSQDSGSEDARLRGERFRRVTRLRILPPCGDTPEQTVFVGEWVDGYQEVHSYAESFGWIVKKAPEDAEATP